MPAKVLTQDAVANIINPLIDRSDQSLASILESVDGKDLSSKDLLLVQRELQKSATLTQLEANILKLLNDLLKDVVQKIN